MNQPQNQDEPDTDVVGRVFVWTTTFFALIFLVAGGYVYWKATQKPQRVEKKTTFAIPERRKPRSVEIPEILFADIAMSAGLVE